MLPLIVGGAMLAIGSAMSGGPSPSPGPSPSSRLPTQRGAVDDLFYPTSYTTVTASTCRRAIASGAPPVPGICRASALTARWASLIDKLRGTIPRWVLFGHIALEANGSPTSHTNLDERGLMQLMPVQSKDYKLDHDKMYDPAYSIAAGVKMYQGYLKVLAPLTFASEEDRWRAAYFMFNIGGGSALSLIKLAPSPITWAGVTRVVLAHPKQHWHWLDASGAFVAFGHAIDRIGALVA